MPDRLRPATPRGTATGDDEAERSFARCASLLRAGDPKASATLSRCIERHPDHAGGWRLLGDTLADLKKFEAALV